MGTTCSTHWENKKYINSSGQKTITGREISEVFLASTVSISVAAD
jgi:hypothetical protein